MRRDALAAQLALISRQVENTQTEIKARQTQLKADDVALKHHRDEIVANQKLEKAGFIGKTRLMQLQRTAVEYESRRAENLADAGSAPPWLGMWLPNIVFGALGLVLVKRMGRESATMRGGGWDDLLFTIREGIARPFRRARRATVQQQPVTG